MLDSLAPASAAAEASPLVWPDADRRGLRWVEQPRVEAPGLDSLLTWGFGAGASRIAFQTGHPVWVRIHGRNHRVTARPLDEMDFSGIVNHLYGADGMARLQGGSDFDTAYAIAVSRAVRLRFRLNATPTRTSRRDGGNIVLRPIADLPPSLEQQGVEAMILDHCRPREGVILVSGATGSGKSTLIAGLVMAKIEDPEGHFDIVEAAAPVEFLMERLRGPTPTVNLGWLRPGSGRSPLTPDQRLGRWPHRGLGCVCSVSCQPAQVGFCKVHVNTMEGFWSLLRSWLQPHRGLSQDKLPLYLSFFQFVHNARRRRRALLGALVADLVE